MKRVIFFLLLIAPVIATQAQTVVSKAKLEQNLSGQLDKSKNNNGRALYYDFVYLSTDEASYKWDDAGATRGSIRYRLDFFRDAARKDLLLSLPVKMRNLITSYYVDVIFTNAKFPDPSLREKGATMIFKKDVHWARTKFVPHEGCEREDGNWERIDKVESYEQLMDYLVRQLDNNVKFDCYR